MKRRHQARRIAVPTDLPRGQHVPNPVGSLGETPDGHDHLAEHPIRAPIADLRDWNLSRSPQQRVGQVFQVVQRDRENPNEAAAFAPPLSWSRLSE
jgi:hypothetical protein